MLTTWCPTCMRYWVEHAVGRGCRGCTTRRARRACSRMNHIPRRHPPDLDLDPDLDPDQERIWPWTMLRTPCNYWHEHQISS